MPDVSIEAIGANVLPALRQLHSCEPDGWCWCVAWEVPTWDGWTERSAEENRALREEHWSRGAFHGYLIRVDGEPAGWSRVGPRAAWPKLCRERELAERDDVFAFTCFSLKPAFRKRGVAHEALKLVLESLTSLGVRHVEAFPRVPGKTAMDDGEVWMGPHGLYERAGFRVVRTTERYQHVARDLAVG